MSTLVVGGNGRTGRRVTERLAGRGYAVRVLSRRPDPAGRGGVEQVRGDLAALDHAVLAGVDGVVVSVETPLDAAGAEALMHRGVAELAAAAAPLAVPVVLVSQIYIDRADEHPELREVILARGRGEQALRASGAPYVVVRPGWLTDEPAGGVRLEQGDRSDGRVSRDTVADACVAALLDPRAQGRTVEVYDGPGPPPGAARWADLLAALAPDVPPGRP